MSARVFLDTSGWIAAVVPGQSLHEQAREAYAGAIRRGARIVTTSLVIAEAHALLLRLRGRSEALAQIDAIRADITHVIIRPDAELEAAAIDRWIRRFDDQKFSFCDAISFELMHRYGIKEALAIDRHFAAAGFAIVQ